MQRRASLRVGLLEGELTPWVADEHDEDAGHVGREFLKTDLRTGRFNNRFDVKGLCARKFDKLLQLRKEGINKMKLLVRPRRVEVSPLKYPADSHKLGSNQHEPLENSVIYQPKLSHRRSTTIVKVYEQALQPNQFTPMLGKHHSESLQQHSFYKTQYQSHNASKFYGNLGARRMEPERFRSTTTNVKDIPILARNQRKAVVKPSTGLAEGLRSIIEMKNTHYQPWKSLEKTNLLKELKQRKQLKLKRQKHILDKIFNN